MYGVSNINSTESVMLVSFTDSNHVFMAQTFAKLAQAGVVVDMISQTAPSGGNIRFCFTASYDCFDKAIKIISTKDGAASPMVSGGYCKINLFGEDMVQSVGVAARALGVLQDQAIEIFLITTSEMDISILVRQEDEDITLSALQNAFSV